MQKKRRKKDNRVYQGRPEQRKDFIASCLDRMYEGAREVEQLKEEYAEVTAELSDMDTLRMLDPVKRDRLTDTAVRVIECEKQILESGGRRNKMNDQVFSRMERFEGSFLDAIRKFDDTEDYHKKIKNDLRRLDNERNAFYIRQDDLERTMSATRDTSILCLVALCAVLVVLFLLNRILSLNVTYAIMAALLLAAVAVVALYFRNSNAAKELRVTESAINRIINVQNTVKIRYVNNRNLLDYYCMKYGVERSSDLKKLVKQFEKEKNERDRLSETEQRLLRAQTELSDALAGMDLHHPALFLRMPDILAYPEDESQYRHELLARRMKLRDRMDYNLEDVIGEAKAEIKRFAETYPVFADDITAQVDAFIREKNLKI